MDRDEMLALYDRFERREAGLVGRRLERTAHLAREIDAPGRPSWIAWRATWRTPTSTP